ncbi:helicase HerA-like domain-containing protein [Stakelama tenebrarum]|uniref:DUF853 family protein n=1 Tax=Stakelama tenebrarum TaxID=2711215 RepID=A0A6G6Y507_9SPHN|nr:helicase HerA-like domain-containing protein [Sphingosinithalassobacter tenebrarum]QIG80034.1 DUF853 family protein [Sphingosinithalassobacter tenebrarum]
MTQSGSIFIGSANGVPQALELKRANRHGLIAGATGTGKTVTLQGIAEGFSLAGVPVFVADVKGDLSGLAMAGSPLQKNHEVFAKRAAEIGYADWSYDNVPVQFWDLFGDQGHPIRTTISEMGPLLLSRLMDLNDTQEGVLTIAFHIADQSDLLLLDLDDLQAMLVHIAENATDLTTQYGNVSKQSVGAIQRKLLQLRTQGGDRFFGEPALAMGDLIGTDDAGKGLVNILAADKLMASPKLYATFLLWLLSQLFEHLPEVGDPDKPVLAFFFDEAHLLFDEAPDALLDKVEQVVRLIRSKGVGVYFVTQSPLDIPDSVSAQLGNRIQHALRAYTPREQKAVRAAAQTFRPNPEVDVESVITELKVGAALVSLLQPDGAPSPVQHTLIKPPRTRVSPVTDDERRALIEADAIGDRYDVAIDRESAAELLRAKADEAAAAAAEAEARDAAEADRARREKESARAAKEAERARVAKERAGRDSPWGRAADSAMRSTRTAVTTDIANSVSKAILGTTRGTSAAAVKGLVRGVLGGLFKGR